MKTKTKTKKQIQVLKPGKFTAMNGTEYSFSESDIAATAAAYDPAKYEAPLVIGHPKTNTPRFGGVAALNFADGILDASPKDIDPQFADWVERKLFNTVSGSFYAPDSPGNPVPGVYYLRHIGFLGGVPPAIKGLNPDGISFSDTEKGVIEFADMGEVYTAGIFRSMREWIISKFGLADADQAIPGYAVATVEDAAREEQEETSDPESTAVAGASASFAEKGSIVTPEQKAALEAENAQLKKQLADAAERDKATRLAARHTANAEFAEGLVKEGKLLPAQKNAAIATLDFIDSADSADKVVEFGEGDAKQPLGDAFKAMLSATTKQVEFAEKAKSDAGAKTVEFAAASGFDVDAEQLEQLALIKAYQQKHGCDFAEAMIKFNQSN